MRAPVAAAWPAMCSRFEGRTWWHYLDVKYLVTTGLGILLETVAESVTYPWFRISDGEPASPTEIAAEYARVKKLRSLAKQGGFAYRPSAKLRLPEASIDHALMVTTELFWNGLKKTHPDIESWPADAQLAVMDLAWQNGPGFTAVKRLGKYVWPSTRAALNAQDWNAAAAAVPGSGDRHDARVRLFKNAAKVAKAGWDREVLWDTKAPSGPSTLPPVLPPVQEPTDPPVAPPVTGPAKPEYGSSTKRVYVDKYGAISEVKTPFLITERTRNMFLEQVRLYHQAGGKTIPYITQGGYNAGGSVSASAGTHDGDAIDTSTKDMARAERKLWELAGMQVGFAGWLRDRIPGLWPDHWHGIPKGGDVSRGAGNQVRDFARSLTGLASRLSYGRIAKLGFASWTFKDYISSWGVSLSALQSAEKTGKYHQDVKDLQWALSEKSGVDLYGDGLFGPQTKAALAKVGPLNADTLVKLNLIINPEGTAV